ncbi:MAG: hypothetical protein ACI4XJ_08760 [Eubacteriales bacterium]
MIYYASILICAVLTIGLADECTAIAAVIEIIGGIIAYIAKKRGEFNDD